MTTVTFHPVPEAIRPHAYREIEVVRADGVAVGSVARLALGPNETLVDPVSWFVVVGGDFRAGRAGSMRAGRDFATIAARYLDDRERRRPGEAGRLDPADEARHEAD